MRLSGRSLPALSPLLLSTLTGCTGLDPPAATPLRQPAAQVAPPACPSPTQAGAIQPAGYRTPTPQGEDKRSEVVPAPGTVTLPSPWPLPGAPAAPACPFAGLTELTVEDLVREVLARNPSLAQMVAAYQAATARYP